MLGKVQPQVKHNADEDLRKQLEDLQAAIVRVTAEREAYRAERDTYCQADLSTVRSVLAYDELKQTNKLHAGDVASVGEEADPARVETEAEAARVEAEAVATRVEKEADGEFSTNSCTVFIFSPKYHVRRNAYPRVNKADKTMYILDH
ncbi:hypothetical protein PsorP6_001280 [Peronosclerospora sorghi]|uniref:Uncharacterized protein n=1 Tax=Peronosclerospora sorghi TaxID=230839 RepID=A0ACC0WZ00_9STRA|nr:hypothetical protein PsorP6_001280 [Peronosclerospora sorghi]